MQYYITVTHAWAATAWAWAACENPLVKLGKKILSFLQCVPREAVGVGSGSVESVT